MRYIQQIISIATLAWTSLTLAQAPRNVTEALTQHQWRWSDGTYQNIPLTFRSDGSMTVQWGNPSQTTTWKWRLHDDPSKFVITKERGSPMEVQFDAAYAAFEGTSDRGKKNAGIRVTPPVQNEALSAAPAAQAAPAAPTPPSPQALADLQRRLGDTEWTFVNPNAFVKVGGATVIKDGAWLTIRLRSNGRFSAWHKDRINHESKWEAVDTNLIRVHDCGPDRRVGLLLKFDAALTTFSAQNEPQTSGKFMSRLGQIDSLVGRWHWRGRGGTVHFREDGMAWMEWIGGETGRWRVVGNDRYEVSWANGKYFDKIRMKSGDKELAIEDKGGGKFGAVRVIPKP